MYNTVRFGPPTWKMLLPTQMEETAAEYQKKLHRNTYKIVFVEYPARVETVT